MPPTTERVVPTSVDKPSTGKPSELDYDAIVIGAGFAGLRMLYELRKQGLSGRIIEAGTGVGGVSAACPCCQAKWVIGPMKRWTYIPHDLHQEDGLRAW